MRLSTLTSLYFIVLGALPAADAAGSAKEAEDFTVYRPKFRYATELVRVAAPVFHGRATFTEMDNKVIISATPKTTATVLKLFDELDRKPRSLRISVRVVDSGTQNAESVGVSGQAKYKGAGIAVGKAGGGSGGQVSLGDKAQVAVDANATNQAHNRNDVQTIEVMEGSEAALSMGSTLYPGGFLAKPLVNQGGTASLNLRQQQGNSNPSLSLSSEVTVPMGEWRSVGNVVSGTQTRQSGIGNRGSSAGSGAKEVQVKVELAP